MRKHDPIEYLNYKKAFPMLSNRRIAADFGVNESTVRRALKAHEKIGYWLDIIAAAQAEEDNKKEALPKVDVAEHSHARQELDEPLRIYGDVAVISDLHIPLYDADYLNVFLHDVEARGIKQCIIAGDFWHADAYGNYFPKQGGIGLDVEIPMGNKVMKLLLKYFDTIYFIKGNHDYRYVKGRNYRVDFVTAMREAFCWLSDEEQSQLVISNLDHCYAHHDNAFWRSDLSEWYICHPTQYTKTPLTTARQMASIRQCNVLVGHSHHCAVGYDPSAQYVVAELGGFFDRHRTAYLRSATTFPVWQQGYALLIDGKLHMRSPGWST